MTSIARYARCSSLTIAALTCLSCAGQTRIELTSDKTDLTAGGIDYANLVARPLLNGNPVGAGVEVEFSADRGSFSPSESLLTQAIATGATGEAKARFYSTDQQGPATITVSFYDETSAQSASTSITLNIGAPTGDQLPVDGTLRLTCDVANIGALRTPAPNIAVRCSLTAQTQRGVNIPAVALQPQFRAEAGSITALDEGGERIFVYSTRSGSSAPEDVEPMAVLGEPSRTDNAGNTRNPRDGLVTIIAMHEGAERFTDTNGNGKLDPGEDFEDAPEPFLDSDDDGRRSDGEWYLDLNSNGQWDNGNNQYDAKTTIMAVYKFLWTGPLHSSPETSRLDPATAAIGDGGNVVIKGYALDENLNPIAANEGNGDRFTWDLNASGTDARSLDDAAPAMKESLGFSFVKPQSSATDFFLIEPNSFSPPSYSFKIEDTFPGDGANNPKAFTLKASTLTSPGPGADGLFLDQISENIETEVQGTVD